MIRSNPVRLWWIIWPLWHITICDLNSIFNLLMSISSFVFLFNSRFHSTQHRNCRTNQSAKVNFNLKLNLSKCPNICYMSYARCIHIPCFAIYSISIEINFFNVAIFFFLSHIDCVHVLVTLERMIRPTVR